LSALILYDVATNDSPEQTNKQTHCILLDALCCSTGTNLQISKSCVFLFAC
jgi:hypothetical protein